MRSTYNPWRDAAERYPDIHIEWADIAPLHGAWMPTERVILIEQSLPCAERRAALAHELAHLDVGDRATADCWFSQRQESAADRLAAWRLIPIMDLAAVLRWCHDPREASDELDVPLSVLLLRAAGLHPAERGLVESVLSRREAVA